MYWSSTSVKRSVEKSNQLNLWGLSPFKVHKLREINDWSRGEHWILFPENFNVSWGEVERYIKIPDKSKFWKGKSKFRIHAEISATISDHLGSRATTVNISRVFTVFHLTSQLLQWCPPRAFGGKRVSFRCHQIMNYESWTMNRRAVAGKTPAI